VFIIVIKGLKIKIETKMLLKEHLELDWSNALIYFWSLTPRQREVKKTQYFILTMKNLGYDRIEIIDFITSGILYVLLYEVYNSLKELGV